MDLLSLARVTVPWGRQEIELQQVDFGAGGRPMMRVRIREGRRFTVLDIDAITARDLARAMAQWAEREIGAAAGG